MIIVAFSNYSICFGHIPPKQLVNLYYKNNYPFASLTDIYMLSGLDEFIKECRNKKIKPIVGITIKILYNNYHGNATFLFKNKEIYLQFIKKYNDNIIYSNNSRAYFPFDYFKNINDLIIIIGNKGSIIDKFEEKKILLQFIKETKKIYKNIYFSYAHIDNEIEKKLSKLLLKVNEEININLLTSYPIINSYEDTDSVYKHVGLIAVSHKLRINDVVLKEKNILYYTKEYAIVNKENFDNCYKESKGYNNLSNIIELVDFNYLSNEIMLYEDFVYKIENDREKIKSITEQQLSKVLYKLDNETKRKYLKRYEDELVIYDKINIYSILYITYDFIKWSNNNGIIIGPGRGSCVGSLIIFLLGITKIDPVKYNLIFERFINLDRYTMADIDIDVSSNERQKLINYLYNKYSNLDRREIHVVSIGVFLKFMEKSSFKDIIRIENNTINFNESNNIIKQADKIISEQNVIEKISTVIKNNIEIIDNIEKLFLHYNKQNFEYVKDFSFVFNNINILAQTFYFNESIKKRLSKSIALIQEENEKHKTEILHNVTLIIKYVKTKIYNINKAINNSKRFSSCIRDTGIHAGGILITNKPYNHYFPVQVGDITNINNVSSSTKLTPNNIINNQSITTQFYNDNIFKFDILGLDTLVIINNTINDVKNDKEEKDRLIKHMNISLFYNKIDTIINHIIDNSHMYGFIFDIMRNAFSKNIFQLDKHSTAQLSEKIKMSKFMDIVDLTSLIRPGSSDLSEIYVENKNNFSKWCLENKHILAFEIIKETCGVLIFQEQIIQIAVDVGFSKKDADNLRYGMGKKKLEYVEKYKEVFLLYCQNKFNASLEDATELFERIKKFASYAFNKSHAVAYSYITLITMFLKACHMIYYAINCINLKIKDKYRIKHTLIELVIIREPPIVFFIYPEINKRHIIFNHINKFYTYIFISLSSIGGLTDNFTKYIKKVDQFDVQTIEKVLFKIQPNKKLLQNMFNMGIFRRYKLSFEYLLNKIEQHKKISKQSLDNVFESYMKVDTLIECKNNISNNIFTKENIKELINNEYLVYESSYIKLNIATLLKMFAKKDKYKIIYFYIIAEKTPFNVLLIRLDNPARRYKLSLHKVNHPNINDVLLKIGRSKEYINITYNIVENNNIFLDEELIKEYFEDKIEINFKKYNIKDNIWYDLLREIDSHVMHF